MRSVKPQARTNQLVTRDLGDELLVYDLERHKAFCLNQVARQVFRHCDGKTTIPAMALRIGDTLGASIDEQTIRLGLVRLEKAHLLDAPLGLVLHSSRRDMLRTLGRAAVVAVPLVTALTVPRSAQAASCFTPPGGCQGDASCSVPANLCHCVAGRCVPK
jgi:hypothetical protein